ncbi:cullin-associated NEDD8-dissociated protein-like protein [Patellaria atrata CBS 101060]|uniref:Cullin-associated NEDD8-dissociated protein-like protein n=1 Tax=Patellaria atrata CBS 101060 TaxID=1346257 RepID=A0A9P4VPD9_9PEZI|nr:cullin-associated NEDD8-dissociated protein-like protein [Patellaria atrata CBS 101060]
MATTANTTPTAHNVALLVPKLFDADSDFRYMALNDLQHIFNIAVQNFLHHDYNTCAKVVDGLLNTLSDSNGEVQNMAIKVLGPFVTRASEQILCPMIEKISNLETGNVVDISIPALALRAIVVALPRPLPGVPRSKQVLEAYSAISKTLIPRLVGYNVIPTGRKDLPAPPRGMLQVDITNGTDSNAIDVLTEVARCFGPMLQDSEIQALQKITFELLESDRTSSVLKKKAVVALSALSVYFSDALLSAFISRLIESLTDPHLTNGRRKLYITILGSMARSIPRKFGPYLKTLAIFVLSALSASEIDEEMEASDVEDDKTQEADEVREAALVAIEGFLASCPQDMRHYTDESIEAGTRLLKYDPNLAEDDGEGMDTDDEAEADDFDDEDFEEEGGFDDEDDSSWKVRRCAAKLLYTLIATRSNGDLLENGTLYAKVAPALISRFKEREENVRLEVLSTLSLLVRNTRDGYNKHELALVDDSVHGSMGPPPSRKRRRGGSDASMFDSQANVSLGTGLISPSAEAPPTTGPRASLAKLSPEIIRGVAQLLKSSSLSTKQASIVLLKDIVRTQLGGLSEFLDQILPPVIESIFHPGAQASGASGASSTATAQSLRTEGLQLLGAIAETHSSKDLQPYLSKVVPSIITTIKEKHSKVSTQGLAAAEQFIKLLSPPRTSQSNQSELEQFHDILINRIQANDADLDVRRKAIHTLGLLLGLTSGSSGLISGSKRSAGLSLLAERLRNELTRIASTRSIETIVLLAQNKSEFSSPWVCSVSLELAGQMRKASRILRGSSLASLKAICITPASRQNLDAKTVRELVDLLLPLLTAEDPHLLGPALVILTTFVQEDAELVVDDGLNAGICAVVKHSIGGGTLDALLALVKAAAERNVARQLMERLLKEVGVSGNPDLLGKVIGTLLVYGGQSVGYTLDAFVTELRSAKDDPRKCLALSVLGEAGLRLGSSSPLQPRLFMDHFQTKSDLVPLAAAISLGRAGVGNIPTYLPTILSAMGQPSSPQYLLLHSLKEILLHKEAEAEILPYAGNLWENLVAASQIEDNRAISAECIGRLAIIDPRTYLPQLQTFLNDRKPHIRGMVISSLRFTFADTTEGYDDSLKPIVIGMLRTMLNEMDLENRRLALTTLNSAAHNKPDLILPHLDELLPLAMNETVVKPELIREVHMGPFKHKVDDGLELRKSAYETLYALLETAFTRIDIPMFYDRIIAGITDEHDIRILCNLMLTKLIVLAPDETRARLEAIAERFRSVLIIKPKENAVKQEVEKIREASKGVIKVSLQLNKVLAQDLGSHSDPTVRRWIEFWDWVRKEMAPTLKTVEDELKEKER